MTTTDQAKGRTWKDPGEPPPVPQRLAVDEITVEVELVTPMLGGGVEPRKHDPNGWLRAASVKGQLRFWWRALHAQSYPKIEDLRQAEGKLFGLPATFDKDGKVLGGPGVVSIVVRSATEIATKPYPEKFSDIGREYGDIGYLLFPAQKGNNPESARLVQPGARASLTIAFRSASHDQRAAVLRALAAWLTLGGIGSRTRRGIGAIACRDSQPPLKLAATVADLKEYVATLCTAGVVVGDDHVFFLAGRTQGTLVGSAQADWRYALRTMAGCWKAGRQARTGKRSDAPAGRSTWPEADTIRRRMKTFAKWERGVEHKPVGSDAAPRARLGLPIGIQFIDAKEQDNKTASRGRLQTKDPRPVMIVHEKGDRFASPVLLCIAKVREGFVPVVIATRPTLPFKAKFDKGTPDGMTIKAGMTDEAILDRVLAPFETNGFDKVFPK